MDIEISEASLQYLNEPARLELQRVVSSFVEDVVAEAERLESGSHATTGDPEITSTHIHDGADLLRKGYAKQRRSRWSVIREVISYTAALAVGLISPLIGVESWAPPVFVVIVVAGVGCYFWNRNENA